MSATAAQSARMPPALSESILTGSAIPPTVTKYGSGEFFDRTLEDAFRARLPLGERLCLRCCLNWSNQGLAAARGGRLRSAEDAFARARRLREGLRDEATRVATTFAGAAEAYLAYRLGQYQLSLYHLCNCLAVDDELEQLPGYAVLHLHKIQLVENVVRVEAVRDRTGYGLRLAKSLLDYISCPELGLPVSARWTPDLFRSLPPEPVAAMWLQVFGEFPKILARDGLAFAERIKIRVYPDHPAARQCRDWLALVLLLLEDGPAAAADGLREFLAAGQGAVPALWHHIVSEVSLAYERVGAFDETPARTFGLAVLGRLTGVAAVFTDRLRVVASRSSICY